MRPTRGRRARGYLFMASATVASMITHLWLQTSTVRDTAPERAAQVTAMTRPTAAALMTPRTRKAKSLSRVDIPREEPARKSDPRLVGTEELEEGEGGEALMGSIYVVGERDEAGACSIDVDTRVSPADAQTSVGVAPVHSYQPWCWTIQAIRA